MQWEGQSACVQVSASNEELQKMFAERERTARPHQPPSRTQELVSMGGIGDPKPRGHLLAGHENLWAWAKLLAEADD